MDAFILILKNTPEKAFDYIAAENSTLSKSELVDIVKELLYAICKEGADTQNSITAYAADELAERYGLSV